MNAAATARWLANAIGQVVKSSKFCVAGTMPAVQPDIEVDGLGAIRLPLRPALAKKLVGRCRVAPYGKGTKTLVDKNVRNTHELDPKDFRLSPSWNAAVASAAKQAAAQLGLPAERVEAKLYKLLVYEKGGFFLPHRDSEKHDRMLASLIVVLPSPFRGGRLIVRHGAVDQKLAFEDAAFGKAACFAAFYADCEHEVERVTYGVRLALAYNLVLNPNPANSAKSTKPNAPAEVLTDSIQAWTTKQPAKPLVFALDHQYTQRGLAVDLLKGADRQLADVVASAAVKADCLVYLAQVSRHLLQFADDGSLFESYSRYSYRAPRQSAITVGETFEDELNGADWTDLQGKKQPWGPIGLDLAAIVSSTPINDWKPTSEDFEGYTGNAGNTLDRWYHRSAIIVWHRDHHYDVIAKAGATPSLPLFCQMVNRLAKTAKKRQEAARRDCIQFARAIVGRWERSSLGAGQSPGKKDRPLDHFSKHLLMLRDRDTIAQFLTILSERDPTLPLASLVVAACREFGWSAFSQELKMLITARPDRRGTFDLPLRDVEWLAAFCCDLSTDSSKLPLAGELCAMAVDRYCETRPEYPLYYSRRDEREISVAEQSLAFLLQALAASGRDDDLSRVLRYVRESPKRFSLDNCQVPALLMLIPWSRQRLGSVHPQFKSWLDEVRGHLIRATAKKPTAPADWARPAEVDCKCEFCAELNAFLADPDNKVGRIPAREDARTHLTSVIWQFQCDVKHALERKGSPYALVLTKTTGSFARAVKRFDRDRRLLKSLQPIS